MRKTYTLLRALDDSAHRFQGQGGFIITCAVLALAHNDPQNHLCFRVPTAPGKPGEMTTVFPVLEKYWNFIILLKILEKWE